MVNPGAEQLHLVGLVVPSLVVWVYNALFVSSASLAESPDGVLLAMGTNRKEVIVWSVQVEKM